MVVKIFPCTRLNTSKCMKYVTFFIERSEIICACRLDENSNWTETEFGRYVSGYLQSAIKIPESFHTTPTTQFRVMARNVNGWSLPAVVSLKPSELVDASKSKSNAVGIVIGVAIACLIILIIITVFFGNALKLLIEDSIDNEAALLNFSSSSSKKV